MDLIRWVRSFLSKRTGHIRFEGHRGDSFSLRCGLPQGSPMSPILFLLYIEPMVHLSSSLFVYADDTVILASGKSLDECRNMLQQEAEKTIAWGKDSGVSIDVNKTELQYFHRKRRFEEPAIVWGERRIEPNDETRWLGVFFDRKMTFKEHVSHRQVRARKVTDHARRLCGPSRGMSVLLLRTAIESMAFLLYGAETWYHIKTPRYLIDRV